MSWAISAGFTYLTPGSPNKDALLATSSLKGSFVSQPLPTSPPPLRSPPDTLFYFWAHLTNYSQALGFSTTAPSSRKPSKLPSLAWWKVLFLLRGLLILVLTIKWWSADSDNWEPTGRPESRFLQQQFLLCHADSRWQHSPPFPHPQFLWSLPLHCQQPHSIVPHFSVDDFMLRTDHHVCVSVGVLYFIKPQT